MASVIDENTQFIDPLTSTPIVNGYIYIGTNGLDAVLNPITIYSDRDLTTPLTNPQRTDSSGRSVNKIWVPGRYSMKVTDSASVQKLNDLDLGELADTGTTLLTNVQGSNAITAEGSPTITTLTDGQLYVFTTILANTGAVTLQIDSTTAYPIKKNHDVALVANDFEANQQIVVSWNSTDLVYELQSNSAIESVNVSGNQTVAGIKTFSTGIVSTILDSNGNEILISSATSAAVNEVTVKNAVTTANPTIQSSGEANTGLILADSNSNEVVILESTASAVNEITVTNAATGNAVDIAATGTDTNIDLQLTAKGTGRVVNSAAVSGYVSGVTEYIESDSGASSTGLNITSVIADSTWESVGPTGSSADNIWTAMDSIPVGAKAVIIKVVVYAYTSTSLPVEGSIYGRVTGSSTVIGDQTRIAGNAGDATLKLITDTNTTPIPIDSSRRFDLNRVYQGNGALTANAYLVGFII